MKIGFRLPTPNEFYILVFIIVSIAISAWFITISVNKSLYSLNSNSEPSFKFMQIHHITLGVHNPLEAEPEPMLLGSALLPATKNLWSDPIMSRVLVDNQGSFGACTAHALSYCWQQARLRANAAWYRPSRCFWYAESRMFLNDFKFAKDNGSTIEATARALSTRGCVAETQWPYEATNIGRAPTPTIRNQALVNKQPTRQLNFGLNTSTNVRVLKTELNEGRCVMIGILVYQSFMSQAAMRTGNIPQPNKRSEILLGGHAIAISGWDDTQSVFTFRNSWGPSVGKGGSFAIPYNYVCNPTLAGDAWVVDSA